MPHAASTAAILGSARYCGTVPLRDVVHFKPSPPRDITRKFYFFDFMKFLGLSFVGHQESGDDDDIASYEAALLESVTVCLFRTVVPLRHLAASKAARLIALHRRTLGCFRLYVA